MSLCDTALLNILPINKLQYASFPPSDAV